MNAVDTNVVVRFLVHDDLKQSAAADRIFASGPVWIAKTVLLETEWVLEKLYGYPQRAIREALLGLLGLKNVHIEDAGDVAAGLALAFQGIELADALHLAGRPQGAAFMSFDQALVRRASRAGVAGVASPI